MRHDLADHDRRIQDTEDRVSETRSAIVAVEKAMVAIVSRLEQNDTHWRTLSKLMFALICGVGALVGDEVFRHIFP
jgi:hypothetical protein